MKFNIGDKIRIIAPAGAKSKARDGWYGTIINYDGCSSGSYYIKFQDGSTDWYFETWLEKVEEDTNIPRQPTVPPMPKKEMDWAKIKEIAEMALTHNKDIVITINADGSKEVEISTPPTSIVETQMRTRYVPESTEVKND